MLEEAELPVDGVTEHPHNLLVGEVSGIRRGRRRSRGVGYCRPVEVGGRSAPTTEAVDGAMRSYDPCSAKQKRKG